MTEILIEYCVPCGLLPSAEGAEHALLQTFGERLDRLTLKPGHGGVLKVRVDDEVIFDKDAEAFDLDLAVRRAEERLRSSPNRGDPRTRVL